MIDYTPNLRPVRDQGRRGTCVAFATTAAHEHARATRRGALADDLSVEQLFWSCKQIDGNGNDGTNFTSARDAVADPGQCDEASWPYASVRDRSSAYVLPAAAAAAPKARATMSALATDSVSIRQILATARLVVAGLRMWDGFYNCATANLIAPDRDIDRSARHAVCFAGLEDTKVMIRNSWGLRWGQDGYAWIELGALAPVLLEAWTIADDLDPD